MKSILIIFFFTTISLLSFGQNQYQDVVYLKNGSIIRGIIIEQIPNKSIKIETYDKSLFVFTYDEIEKITKELEVSRNNNKNIGLNKRGYLGISVGPSIPIGKFADKNNGVANTGVQANLLNFGYLFSKNVGICASWFGAANPIDMQNVEPWSYGGIIIGPLISMPLSNKVDFDIRPMIGFSATTFPKIGNIASANAVTTAYDLGTTFRFNVGNKLALTLSADYFSTKPEFDLGFVKVEQQITTLSLCGGLVYRLK